MSGSFSKSDLNDRFWMSDHRFSPVPCVFHQNQGKGITGDWTVDSGQFMNWVEQCSSLHLIGFPCPMKNLKHHPNGTKETPSSPRRLPCRFRWACRTPWYSLVERSKSMEFPGFFTELRFIIPPNSCYLWGFHSHVGLGQKWRLKKLDLAGTLQKIRKSSGASSQIGRCLVSDGNPNRIKLWYVLC